MDSVSPYVPKGDWPSAASVATDRDSSRVGKFRRPPAASSNHLLAASSAGSLNNFTKYRPAVDSGLYPIKYGQPIDEPAEMLLIKNDPIYHESWLRALVPCRRIYGIDEPAVVKAIVNIG